MLIKGIIDEDFVNYNLGAMYIATASCSFKCDKECGGSYCQNSSLANAPSKNIATDNIIKRYLHNPITKAIIFSGLEPFDQFFELFDFIQKLRLDYNCKDTVVIYTGYTEDEISAEIKVLQKFPNIIVKFGRFIPNEKPKYDKVLGVKLASPNQYGKRIS